jgi:hypothetical protein
MQVSFWTLCATVEFSLLIVLGDLLTKDSNWSRFLIHLVIQSYNSTILSYLI